VLSLFVIKAARVIDAAFAIRIESAAFVTVRNSAFNSHVNLS
jgi:hypothetical protein